MKVAAVQMEPVVADVAANLVRSEALACEAGRTGAELIVLPEFFTTGMGFVPELADCALPVDGDATQLLSSVARTFGAAVGGSFLCRDPDGQVRNAFLLVDSDGVVGRHNKDLPTMWENCFYVGAEDDGLIPWQGWDCGVVLCLEFDRTGTARRLRGRVDLLLGASAVWSVPDSMPGPVYRALEARMAAIDRSRPRTARMVGAPLVEATMCGQLDCATPWMPGLRYRTYLRGGAQVLNHHGQTVARRDRSSGPGVVTATVHPGRHRPDDAVPDRYWVEPLGQVGNFLWRYQRLHGQRWYRRHRRVRPPMSPATSR